MKGTTTFELPDGVRVVAPDSLEFITPYVLREQLDWFEEELPFVRTILQPGQKALDVGANYGVFTLSMAQAVGPTGAVWAFEPASATAKILAQGISANGFGHVYLQNCALSSHPGTAQLALNDNSEHNSLAAGAAALLSETVRLDTLDHCMERLDWRDIAFVKIDAEGEESNILKGGERFLSEQSPLILYEVKAQLDIHLELVAQFAAIGYASYRFVRGLNLLAPFDSQGIADGYLLNLFCCKPDRAAMLAKRGLLLEAIPTASDHAKRLAALLESGAEKYGWRQTLTKLPYGKLLEDRWMNAANAVDGAKNDEALACFEASIDLELEPIDRFVALEHSHQLLVELCATNPINMRCASLARVSLAQGERHRTTNALIEIGNRIALQKAVEIDEPFLAPGTRFDAVEPGVNIAGWVFASVLEELERVSAHSSYFTGAASKPRLELIRSLGFASEEMLRRLDLIERRFASST